MLRRNQIFQHLRSFALIQGRSSKTRVLKSVAQEVDCAVSVRGALGSRMHIRLQEIGSTEITTDAQFRGWKIKPKWEWKGSIGGNAGFLSCSLAISKLLVRAETVLGLYGG